MARLSISVYLLCVGCCVIWMSAYGADASQGPNVEEFLTKHCESMRLSEKHDRGGGGALLDVGACVRHHKDILLAQLEESTARREEMAALSSGMFNGTNSTDANMSSDSGGTASSAHPTQRAVNPKEELATSGDGNKKNPENEHTQQPTTTITTATSTTNNNSKDPITSLIASTAVGVALLIWLKSREGFTTKNATMISLQTVLVFLGLSHTAPMLMWLLDSECWEYFTVRGWRSPQGLIAGLLSVIVWHVIVLCYYAIRREMDIEALQKVLPERGSFLPGLVQHFARPEAFVMVFGYLTSVWMFDLLPASYYDYAAPVSPLNVLVKFLMVDFLIFASHWLEHAVKPLYRIAHKQHHKYINPSLFVAFSGSVADTFCQILVPLFVTARTLPYLGIHITNWDFVVFGSIYANQFMLLHIEYRNPWDFLLEMFSIGTSEDHNVHHATFNYNYGHFFMIYDKIFGTYRSPLTVRALVRSDLAANSSSSSSSPPSEGTTSTTTSSSSTKLAGKTA